ncbi:MAG: asparagine synthase (glutamine-hydrolyzing) [Candidatus Methanomethyliaceae archaeon]
MCGICGIWNLNGRPATADEIRAMADMLAHRGPDAEGYYLDGPLALGHRRLAILDLTPTGNQPMGYANGRNWITYNGEIYNFLELRAELEQKGYAFRSGSDTEVILAAYAAWGPECVLRFNGMWAFAIWDSLERRLFLARDRFGIKPLYYLHESDRFAFASEMKAFLRLAGFTPRANLRVLKAELLDVHSQEWGEDCLLIGIRRLPPGCYLQVGADGQIRTHKWWCTRDHLPDVPARFDDHVEHFRLLFEDACRLRLRSDVPIATCLSGGIDSSSVVCTLAEVAKQGTARIAPAWQRAFIASFPGAPRSMNASLQRRLCRKQASCL